MRGGGEGREGGRGAVPGTSPTEPRRCPAWGVARRGVGRRGDRATGHGA